MSWSVVVRTRQAQVKPVSEVDAVSLVESDETRYIFDPESGLEVEARLYHRDELPFGSQLTGPAIVTEDQTSTIIPAGWQATVNGLGYLVLTRVPSP